MLIFTASCRLLRTMKMEQLLRLSVNSNSVQSTIANNKYIQQTVIDLVPMMTNPRIALLVKDQLSPNCMSRANAWTYFDTFLNKTFVTN